MEYYDTVDVVFHVEEDRHGDPGRRGVDSMA